LGTVGLDPEATGRGGDWARRRDVSVMAQVVTKDGGVPDDPVPDGGSFLGPEEFGVMSG
jgi:hypothetical protein